MAEDTVDTGITEASAAEQGAQVDVSTDNAEVGTATETNTTSVEEGQRDSSESTDPVLDYNAIKVPDGVSVSDEDRASFIEIVDKFGFKNQEGLQNFVDWMFAEAQKNEAQMKQQSEESEAASKKQWEEIKNGWETSLKSDADFGKEYDLNIKRANDAMLKYGGSELAGWLKDSDLTGQPVLIKTFARIGKEIEDARLIRGQSSFESNKVKRDRYNQPMLVYKD